MTETLEIKNKLLEINNLVYRTQLDVFKEEPHTNVEWFNIALTNMVHSNIAAFITMMEDENFFMARAIIRMQLNCLMRLFSIFIIQPKVTWIERILFSEDCWKSKITKNSKNISITDTFLCEELQNNKILPNAKYLYKKYSKFIHPSNLHFNEAVEKWYNHNNSIEWATKINITGKSRLSKEEIIICYEHMIKITDKIIEYMKQTKQQNSFPKYRLATKI